jgi:hypothetical protein
VGKLSRTKGAAFEKEIARALREIFVRARRGIGQARAANEVPDVDGTPFWIETKHGKSVSVRAAYRQALAARGSCPELARRAHPILVVHREDREETLATLPFDFLLLLLTANWKLPA